MKRMIIMLISLLTLQHLSAQKITYAIPEKGDSKNIEFEILGKVDDNILIYKKANHQSLISVYDASMNLISKEFLNAIPESASTIGFIKVKTGFLIVYQYESNHIVYCEALHVSLSGTTGNLPNRLDSTEIGFFADDKIYAVAYSEDKSKLLIYKRLVKNKELSLTAKLFNNQLIVIDSIHKFFSYNTYKDFLSDVYIDNDGNMLFAKETKNRFADNYHSLEIFMHKKNSDSLFRIPVPLDNKYIDHVLIKVDNLNKNYLINSYYHEDNKNSLDGLFTMIFSANKLDIPKIAFNTFSESFLNSIKNTQIDNYSIDKLIPKNILLKKNGSFVLIAENAYSESQNTNNQWNMNPNMGFSLSNNNYYNNSPYNYSYGGYDNYNQYRTTRYSNNDILLVSIDSSLHLQWNNVITKKQSEVDDDTYLSFSTLNSGSELFFLYIANQNNKNIISNQSLMPTGDIKRYPAIKNTEEAYYFMPKLAKQIGNYQTIIPFLYQNQIGFAKIEF